MTGVVRYDMETTYGDFVANDIIQSQWADDVNATLDNYGKLFVIGSGNKKFFPSSLSWSWMTATFVVNPDFYATSAGAFTTNNTGLWSLAFICSPQMLLGTLEFWATRFRTPIWSNASGVSFITRREIFGIPAGASAPTSLGSDATNLTSNGEHIFDITDVDCSGFVYIAIEVDVDNSAGANGAPIIYAAQVEGYYTTP